MKQRIRVMIVDDSALVRRALSDVLAGWDDISVIATASDAFQAVARLREQVPDVILLDLEMPRVDGLSFLRQLMRQHPIPTIICSAVAEAGSPAAIAALEAGALEIIEKPTLTTRQFFDSASQRIHDAILAAAGARVLAVRGPDGGRTLISARPESARRSRVPLRRTDYVIAVGASTGGTEAIRIFLKALPSDAPGVVIVQHMPKGFTAGLAKRLDQLCQIRVAEAAHGDPISCGQALIAPGDRHVCVVRGEDGLHVELLDSAPVNRHRPSVDVLFNSVAEACAGRAVGVIMTGMGDDGARGLKVMRDAGAETFAQDEATCVVYGMPREAVRIGAASHVLPLQALADAALGTCRPVRG
jgi:two-component system, chemotaxis family, protein-glutamate methylesterase/glutaminase